MASIIVRPDVRFGALEEELCALGWTRTGHRRGADPLVAGEPELAAFVHDSGVVAVYTFNPLVYLRRLDLAGPGADALAGAMSLLLDTLEDDDLGEIETALVEDRVLMGGLAMRAAEIQRTADTLCAILLDQHARRVQTPASAADSIAA